jgi:hypothetical protein
LQSAQPWRPGADIQVLLKNSEDAQGLKEAGVNSGCKGESAGSKLPVSKVRQSSPGNWSSKELGKHERAQLRIHHPHIWLSGQAPVDVGQRQEVNSTSEGIMLRRASP